MNIPNNIPAEAVFNPQSNIWSVSKGQNFNTQETSEFEGTIEYWTSEGIFHAKQEYQNNISFSTMYYHPDGSQANIQTRRNGILHGKTSHIKTKNNTHFVFPEEYPENAWRVELLYNHNFLFSTKIFDEHNIEIIKPKPAHIPQQAEWNFREKQWVLLGEVSVYGQKLGKYSFWNEEGVLIEEIDFHKDGSSICSFFKNKQTNVFQSFDEAFNQSIPDKATRIEKTVPPQWGNKLIRIKIFDKNNVEIVKQKPLSVPSTAEWDYVQCEWFTLEHLLPRKKIDKFSYYNEDGSLKEEKYFIDVVPIENWDKERKNYFNEDGSAIEEETPPPNLPQEAILNDENLWVNNKGFMLNVNNQNVFVGTQEFWTKDGTPYQKIESRNNTSKTTTNYHPDGTIGYVSNIEFNLSQGTQIMIRSINDTDLTFPNYPENIWKTVSIYKNNHCIKRQFFDKNDHEIIFPIPVGVPENAVYQEGLWFSGFEANEFGNLKGKGQCWDNEGKLKYEHHYTGSFNYTENLFYENGSLMQSLEIANNDIKKRIFFKNTNEELFIVDGLTLPNNACKVEVAIEKNHIISNKFKVFDKDGNDIIKEKPMNVTANAIWDYRDNLWQAGERETDLGFPDGKWRYWTEDGTLKAETIYDDLNKTSAYINYHKDGSISQTGTCKNKLQEGLQVKYRCKDPFLSEIPWNHLPENVWRIESYKEADKAIWHKTYNDKNEEIDIRPNHVTLEAKWDPQFNSWSLGDYDGDGFAIGNWTYWDGEGNVVEEVNYDSLV